jgi:AraC-like DNA-binding protein
VSRDQSDLHSDRPGDAVSAASAQGGENGAIIDQACRSTKLDELEDILNRLVWPEKLVPSSRDPSINGAFRYRGASDLGLFNVRFGREIDVELASEEQDDKLAFAMTSGGQGQLKLRNQEFSLSARNGVVLTSASMKTLRFKEDTENYVFVTQRDKIASYCAKLLGRPVERSIVFDVEFLLDTDAGQSWVRILEHASDEFGKPHSLVRQFPAARRNLEQMIITGLLLGHRHTFSDLLLNPQSAAAPFYVKRAEAFIEEHFMGPISLADIAAHAGVSARSLQSGFQAFRHMTPMGYLRSLRLQQVHRALLAADPAVSTVTEIALMCGFTHMGEFGSAYKRTFGVMPRDTFLNRAKT